MRCESVTVEQRSDGVAVVWINCPGQKVNTLGPELVDQVESVFEDLQRDDNVAAMVVASGKNDSFIAGADLKILETITTAGEAAELSARGNALLLRISRSPKPVVAAVHGAALGGGLEVALACRFLLASNHPSTVLALPEVQLGLLPAAGGTQRLVSRVGLTRALPLLLTGRKVRAQKARRLGLVDAVTTPGGLIDTAARVAIGLADGRRRKRGGRLRLVDRLAARKPMRSFVLKKAAQQVKRRTRGNYPAPEAILDAVATGLSRGLDAGLRRESQLFGELVTSPESRELVRLFLSMNETKGHALPAEPAEIDRVGVIGAGLMGAGVASVSLAHAAVVLHDKSEGALCRARRELDTGLDKQIRAGAITRTESDRRRSRLRLTTEKTRFAGCRIIIEAVFEDLDLKRTVLAELEDIVATDAVIASNTSALPICEIATNARHPERVLGMHYFSPVPKMPLLEVVRSDATSDESLATAVAFGRRQGKTCIVVADGPGFYTTRILAPYLDEAIRLASEGAGLHRLDSAVRDFGFPIGPIALIDEVGIDVGAHVAESLGPTFAERGARPTDAMQRLAARNILGKKSGRGFFVYETKKRPRPVNPEVTQVLDAPRKPSAPPSNAVDRLVLMMVNEAALCLQEGVIESPRDGDLGAVLGLGFPPFRGGPFRWIDSVGAHKVVDQLRELESQLGARFTPADLLVETARNGRSFR